MAATATKDERTTLETLATRITGIADQVSKMKTDSDGADAEKQKLIAECLAELEKLKTTDVKALKDEIEKIQASQTRLFDSFRAQLNSGPLAIPGLGDESEAKKFSALRAISGVLTGKWENAGLEKEAMDAYATVRANTTGTSSGGALFIPDQVIPDVIFGMYQRAAFISLDGDGNTIISVIQGLTGSPVRIPKFDGGCIAYWIGAEDEFVESSAAVGQINMTPKKIGVLTKIPTEVLKFTSWGYENLLRQDMMRALARKVDLSIAYGVGTSNQPAGICSSVNRDNLAILVAETFDKDKAKPESVLVYSAEDGEAWDGTDHASSAGAELTFDDLSNMRGMLEDLDVDTSDFRTVSHPRFFRKTSQIKVSNFDSQATEKPYILGMPIISKDRLEMAIGPYVESTQIRSKQKAGASLAGWTSSSAAKFGDVFAGNFREVLFGRWGGIEIDDDNGRGKGFTSDLVYVKLKMWCDIGFRHPMSVVVCPDAKMIT